MESTAIHSAKHILFIVGIILLTGSLSGILAQNRLTQPAASNFRLHPF